MSNNKSNNQSQTNNIVRNSTSNHVQSTIHSPPSRSSQLSRSPSNRSPLNRSPSNKSSFAHSSPPKIIDQFHHNNGLNADEVENSISDKSENNQYSTENNQVNDHQSSDHLNNTPNEKLTTENRSTDSKSSVIKSKSKEEKDSPAFRLRTRRSTPRKLDSIYSSPYPASRKTSLYSPNSCDQLQAKVAKLKNNNTSLNDVKRNLFESPDRTQSKTSDYRSPATRSLVEDVDLNVFAENILVDKLVEGKNNLNYLCLRIIEVLDEESLNDTSNGHLSVDNNHPKRQRLLKIYCQQAETKSTINIQKPVIMLHLYDDYVNFKKRFTVGKLLEIVKFEVKLLSKQPTVYRHNHTDIQIYPYYIELKANRDIDWVPLISIKKKFEPANLSLLNVINTQNKYQDHDNIEDQPPTNNPKVIFSSYGVKSEPTEQHSSNNIQATNSPTIKRFMRTINKNYAQDTNKLKLKIKREKS